MHAGVVETGSRRELFVDPSLLDRAENARLVLHHPQPAEVALVCDRPWETEGPGYPTVLYADGLYRMYYRAAPSKECSDLDQRQCTCYAESRDGIIWHKPELGLFEFNGSTRNNIIWQGVLSHNFTPFLDTRPDCPEEERFKAVGGCCAEWGGENLVALASPDGIHWRKMGNRALPLNGQFDSQNVVFRDEVRRVYRAFWRKWRAEGSRIPPGRDICAAVSEDFENWTELGFLDYQPNRSGSLEPDRGDDPSGDHHQLYTNNIQPCPAAPHILIGLPARYCDRGWTVSTDSLPDLDERREMAGRNIAGGRPTRLGTALWDTLLMASLDGRTFHVWPEAFVRPGIQRRGNWFYGQAGCAWGIVETPSCFASAPPELSLYVTDNARVNEPGRLRRFTLRPHGFVSAYAPLTGGTITTRAFIFDGNRLEINFSSSAGGRLRVEIQEPDGKPLPGFSLDDCHMQYGDQLDRIVSWKCGADVGSIAERPVRLRIEIKDADIFAFRFFTV